MSTRVATIPTLQLGGMVRLVSQERPSVAAKARELRERRRFSQEELAERAGVSAQTIANLENGFNRDTGKERKPDVDTLRRIADALAEGRESDAALYYRELMDAAGYLDGLPLIATPTRPQAEPAKPPIPVIARGVSDNPNLPPHVQQAILTILQMTEDANRRERNGG